MIVNWTLITPKINGATIKIEKLFLKEMAFKISPAMNSSAGSGLVVIPILMNNTYICKFVGQPMYH